MSTPPRANCFFISTLHAECVSATAFVFRPFRLSNKCLSPEIGTPLFKTEQQPRNPSSSNLQSLHTTLAPAPSAN